MIKLKKIIILISIFSCVLVKSYAGYSYENEFCLFRLNRNIVKPIYTKIYDKDTWTNEDVLVTINANKVLEIIDSDFKLSKDGKTLTKTVSENEKGIIKVRDEDYNYDEIEYEVSWIDREVPNIIGAENGKTYNTSLNLQYTDNGEIEEIFVDKYDTEFNIYEKDIFIDSGTERFIPFTKNSITAWVKAHPKGVEKYRYYLNDVLYCTTEDNKYTFEGLEENTYGIKIKVEGLDRNENVIASKEYTMKTGVFENVILEKTDTSEEVKFIGISNKVTKLVCYTWIDGMYDSTLKTEEIEIQNNEAICKFDIKDFENLKSNYKMHFYFTYNSNGSEVHFVYGGNIDMSKTYSELQKNPSVNDFINNGNYYVRVTDKAGNENEIDFIIEK